MRITAEALASSVFWATCAVLGWYLKDICAWWRNRQ